MSKKLKKGDEVIIVKCEDGNTYLANKESLVKVTIDEAALIKAHNPTNL